MQEMQRVDARPGFQTIIKPRAHAGELALDRLRLSVLLY